MCYTSQMICFLKHTKSIITILLLHHMKLLLYLMKLVSGEETSRYESQHSANIQQLLDFLLLDTIRLVLVVRVVGPTPDHQRLL